MEIMLCLFNGLKQGLNSLVTNRFTSMYVAFPQKHNLDEIHIRIKPFQVETFNQYFRVFLDSEFVQRYQSIHVP